MSNINNQPLNSNIEQIAQTPNFQN